MKFLSRLSQGMSNFYLSHGFEGLAAPRDLAIVLWLTEARR